MKLRDANRKVAIKLFVIFFIPLVYISIAGYDYRSKYFSAETRELIDSAAV